MKSRAENGTSDLSCSAPSESTDESTVEGGLYVLRGILFIDGRTPIPVSGLLLSRRCPDRPLQSTLCRGPRQLPPPTRGFLDSRGMEVRVVATCHWTRCLWQLFAFIEPLA